MWSNEYKDKRDYDVHHSSVPVGKIDRFNSGPYGLGDPEDLNLTWRERRFALPIKRREIILEEFCPGVGEAYTSCRQIHTFTKWFQCSEVSKVRADCVQKYWNSPGLEEQAQKEYLEDRSLYRSTGMKKSERLKNERDPIYVLFSRVKTYEEYLETKNMGFFETLGITWKRTDTKGNKGSNSNDQTGSCEINDNSPR